MRRAGLNTAELKTTTIARSVDDGDRPERQYELCSIDAEQVVERERTKGRGDRETGSRAEQHRRVMIGGRSGRSGADVASIPPFLRCAPRSGISAFSLSGRQRSQGLLRQKARNSNSRFAGSERLVVWR